MLRATGLLLTVLISWPAELAAVQCADGTPQPCRVASAATARRDPPIDDRTWLILPFDNLARSTDMDVVRDASVTLLYLEMSRWNDVTVVDDSRVADLMRDVPAGGRIDWMPDSRWRAALAPASW